MDAGITNSTALSIVIPCLNEAAEIASALDALKPLRDRGAEVLVVDGGSTDQTMTIAAARVDCVIATPCGRALQMNAGARSARGAVLLFLHADTRLPADADRLISEALERRGADWGRFDVTICGRHPMLKLIAAAMNLRSRLTGIATGDQAIFVRRATFEQVGGYPEIRLMEDVALSRALKACGAPRCLAQHVLTSGRRWEKHGVLRTILLMWRLRLAFYLGADPDDLALRYAAHK